MTDDFTIRPFRTVEEYRECVRMQEETWGHGFSERVPTAILKVAQILGGVAAGAYDAEDRLAGFVFGMTGLREGELVHWSDMLAVRPGAQNSGLGSRLKLYQRDEVLARGVERILWTFDPLQAKNAHLNFAKLGIVVREYVEDMYGDTDSPLHHGIGTDRFIALWLLRSERVEARLAGGEIRTPDVAGAERVLSATTGREGRPLPGEPVLSADAPRLLVAIPSDILSIMAADMPLAAAWRMATRVACAHYLRNGYEVRELVRGDVTSDYVLERVRDPSPRNEDA